MKQVFTSRITQLLGIDHPVVCGGMTTVGRAELAAAVSNAGALGMVTALTTGSPENLELEIAKTRELTDRPFGINLTILPTINPVPFDEYADVIASSGVAAVETAGRNPEQYIPKFKEGGLVCIHKAVSVRHALTAQRIGVDIVSIDGFECAGHPGEDDVSNMVLVPAASRQLDIPVLASGGFGKGRALSLRWRLVPKASIWVQGLSPPVKPLSITISNAPTSTRLSGIPVCSIAPCATQRGF